MASYSSSASRSLSPASRSTWSSDVDRPPRDGAPSCVTTHRTSPPWTAPRYLICDRDCVYGTAVTRRMRTMGIRDKPIAPGSPWQNGFAERLIGSIRRECVDHVLVLGEAQLRPILTKYAAYYNELRTHRSLDKDAPVHRAIQHVSSACRTIRVRQCSDLPAGH